jgi:hypothetical protein
MKGCLKDINRHEEMIRSRMKEIDELQTLDKKMRNIQQSMNELKAVGDKKMD